MRRSIRIVTRVLVVLGLTSLLLAPAAAAWAAPSYPTPPGPTDPCGPNGLPVIGVVNGVFTCGPKVSAVQVLPQQTTQSSGALAFTGADIALLVVVAGALTAGGVVLVRLSRRPKAALG